MTAYVYIKSEPQLWTVGFYRPDGKWEPESDHAKQSDAAERTAWLNDGLPISVAALLTACKTAVSQITGGSEYPEFFEDNEETLVILKRAISRAE